MSRAGGLPTPQQSTDIRGKNDSKLAYAEPDFALPESALSGKMNVFTPDTSRCGAQPIDDRTDETGPPDQLPSPAFSAYSSYERAAKPPVQEISLPPPPSRSRRIIQVKPKPQAGKRNIAAKSKKQPFEPTKTSATVPVGGTTSFPDGTADTIGDESVAPQNLSAAGATTTSSKKRKASSTAAGSRKIARKTAHSLIERRRRSKMNEEYAVLKGLIPACAGQEMHKLSILQAGIEYVRYLHTCIDELREAPQSQSSLPPVGIQAPSEGHPSKEESQKQRQKPTSSSPSTSDSAPLSPSEHVSHSPALTESSSSVVSPVSSQRPLSSSAHRRSSHHQPNTHTFLPPPSTTTSARDPSSPSAILPSALARLSTTYTQLLPSSSTATLPSPSHPSFFSVSSAPPPVHSTPPSRSSSYSHSYSHSRPYQHPSASFTPSPIILPRAQHSSPLEDEDAASRALLMLNARDRRGLGPAGPGDAQAYTMASGSGRDRERERGIRVSDLLGS